MLVVLSHAGLTILPGGAGVTFFFVVSGFIITHLMLREHERTNGFRIGKFYRRRALKLFPPLVLIVIVPTLIYGIRTVLDRGAVVSQIFFGYNWVSIVDPTVNDRVLPGSGVTWSLAIEEQFYIGFALLWLVLVAIKFSSRLVLWTAITAVVLANGWRLLLALDGASELRIERGTDTRVDALATGIIIAIAFAKWRTDPRVKSRAVLVSGPWVLVAGMALFLVSVAVRNDIFQLTFKYTLQQMAIALIIMYGLIPQSGAISRVFFRIVSLKAFQVVGLASYSIYLAHLPVIYLCRWMFADQGGFFDSWVGSATLAAVGIVVGLLVWRIVEVPIEALKHRRVEPR